MTDDLLIEFLCSLHLSNNVSAPGFDARGGVLLVSSSGHMKTTFLKVLRRYGNFRGVSDMTIRGLDMLRDPIIDGTFCTLGFYEMRKLYERRDDVANSMEMALSALIEEGYGLANWKDQSVPVTLARCMVIGALTRGWYDQQVSRWKDTLLRRVLILHYRLARPDDLIDAVEKWEHIAIGGRELPELPTVPIQNTLNEKERGQIRRFMVAMRGDCPATPFQMMCKVACVMRWHQRRQRQRDRTMEKIEQLSQLFRPDPITSIEFSALKASAATGKRGAAHA